MFDLGWTELLVIGIVALIVVGPKDLPVLFRKLGQFVGKAKGMAREFSRAMNDAADESGMRDVASGLNKSLKAASNPISSAMDGVKSATSGLTDIDPDSATGKLKAERADQAKKIQASTARAAADRKAREAQEALAKADAAEAELNPKAPAPAVAKPAAAKKAAPAKKAAAAKPATKTAAKPKPAAKTAAKKAAPKPKAAPKAKKSDT